MRPTTYEGLQRRRGHIFRHIESKYNFTIADIVLYFAQCMLIYNNTCQVAPQKSPVVSFVFNSGS
jgi:hypothetical protein